MRKGSRFFEVIDTDATFGKRVLINALDVSKIEELYDCSGAKIFFYDRHEYSIRTRTVYDVVIQRFLRARKSA